jgi:outer membrane beta-barrel protein
LRKLCSLLLALSLLLPLAAVAAPVPKKDRVDVFQYKTVTKKRRHEFMPTFSLTLNDPFLQTIAVGGSYTYHISEGIAFEVMGAWTYASNTSLVEDFRSGNRALPNDWPAGLNPYENNKGQKRINPATSRSQFYVNGCLLWAPLQGKFAFGGSFVVDMELFLSAGVGYLRTNQDPYNMLSTIFGFGFRFFLAKWVSLRIDLRDHIFSQTLLGKTVLSHNVFLGVGIGFIFPTAPVRTSRGLL